MGQKYVKVRDYKGLEVFALGQEVGQKQGRLGQTVGQTDIEYVEVLETKPILSTFRKITSSLVSIVLSGCEILQAAAARQADKTRKRKKFSEIRNLGKKEDKYLKSLRKQKEKVSEKNVTNIYVNGDAIFNINN